MPRSKKIRSRRVKSRRGAHGINPATNQPMVLLRKTFRFQCGTAGNYTITGTNLSTLVGVGTGSSMSGLFSRVKLRSVEMWGPVSSTLVPVTITCSLTGTVASYGGAAGSGLEYSDTAMSDSAPAHLYVLPRTDEDAGDWHSSNDTDTLATLTCTVGTLVDITLDAVIDSGGPFATYTGAALAAGAIYWGNLDGHNGVLHPVGNLFTAP